MSNKILKFSAEWCAPCKELKRKITGDSDFDNIEIVDIDIESEDGNDMVEKYGVRGVPTLIYFKGEEQVGRTVGNVSKDVILSHFK